MGQSEPLRWTDLSPCFTACVHSVCAHVYIHIQTYRYTYVYVSVYVHTHMSRTRTHRRVPGTAKHGSDTSTAGFAVGQRVAQLTRSPFTAALEIQVLRTDTALFLTDGTRHGKYPPALRPSPGRPPPKRSGSEFGVPRPRDRCPPGTPAARLSARSGTATAAQPTARRKPLGRDKTRVTLLQ